MTQTIISRQNQSMPVPMVNLVEFEQVVAILDSIASPAIVDRALRSADISRKVFKAAPGFLPYRIEAVVLESVARSVGVHYLGAQVAMSFDYSAYGFYAGYVLGAQNLGSALMRGRSALSLTHPGSDIVLRKSGNHLVVGRTSNINSIVGHRHLDEGAVFIIGHVIRHFLGPNYRPAWIEITGNDPRSVSFLEELICAPVRTGAPMPALAVRTVDLKAPNPNRPRPELAVTLTELPSLMGVTEPKTMKDIVRQVIRMQLMSGDLSMDGVALRLSVGPRTLQRALSSEGTSYREIREQLLHERACELLSDSNFAIDNISKSLGYSEPNSFRRAFRAWIGIAPSEYRAANRGTTASSGSITN